MNLKMNASPDVRKASTPRRYYVALASAALIFMLILIPTILNNSEKPSDSVVVADEIPLERLEEILAPYEYDEILHVEEVDEGVVVFFTGYIQKEIKIEVLNATFIRKTKDSWEESKEGAEHAIIDQADISHEFISPTTEDSPFPMVFGKITNADISKVLVRKVESKQEYEAEVIYSESGRKYWFAIVDIEPDEMFELHGVTREGQLIYSIDTLYANGNSPVLEEVNPEGANFELTAEELDVYQQLKMGFNQQLLLDLPPISIAKLFVQATSDEEWELQYELYTDREDIIRIEKEEYFREMVFPDKNVLFGIQDGTFHDRGESGYISFTNLYGQELGFSMVKEVDGSWAVSFMPIQ
jgi:hypothetical protein